MKKYFLKKIVAMLHQLTRKKMLIGNHIETYLKRKKKIDGHW
jgi:hypothetical protein